MAWFKVLCILTIVATHSFATDEPAKPKPADTVILNVNREGRVIIGYGDQAEVLSIPMTKKYLKDQIELDKQQSTPEVWEKGGGRSLLVIRAHQETTFKHLHDVMAAASQAGYLDVQLRFLKPVLKAVDEELTIQFYAGDKGNLGRVIVALSTGDVELKNLKDLFTFLSKRADETKSAPKLKCEFAAKLKYEIVIQVIDGCKQAGYERTEPALLSEKRQQTEPGK